MLYEKTKKDNRDWIKIVEENYLSQTGERL
jgi:hypothetical protein